MNIFWVICIAREDMASLAALRLLSGLEVAEGGSEVWIRGQQGVAALDAKLSVLPVRGRYELLPPDQLRQVGHRVPSARLPELRWQPLQGWLQVELPAAAFPANEPAAIPLRLVRSADEREPGLLMTTLEEFMRFAAHAPQVRLDRLEFAASVDGQVLVRGTPLPSLRGRRYVLYAGVAVAAGFGWQPVVSADVLARRFGVSGDALVIWNEDGTITRLHQEQFVPATRSSIRTTGQVVAEAK